MHILRTRSIRQQIVLASVLLLVPVAIGAAWSATRTRRERSDEVRQEAATIAATSAAYFDQSLRGLDAMAAALVRDPLVIALKRPETDRLFAALMRDQAFLLDIALIAPDGTLKGTGLPTEISGPIPLLPPVQEAFATGRPVVTDLLVGRVTHKAVVFLVYPVFDGSTVVGVLSIGLDLVQLQARLAAIPLSDASIVTLTNGSGLVLARSREPDRFIGTTADIPPPSLPGSEPQTSQQVDSDGVERLVASAGLRRVPWIISVGIPTSLVTARVWPLWRRSLLIVVLASLSSLLLALWMGSHLSRMLHNLRAAAERIATGDLSPVAAPPASNKEVALLQNSFGGMAENLREMRQTLARQVEEERALREQFESLQLQVVRQERLAAVGVLVSGVAHELNNPLQAIMGAAELLERCKGLPVDARPEVEMVKIQSCRASEIIRNLSRFSAQQSTLPTPVDLRDVVSEVAQLRGADLDSGQIACEVHASSTGLVRANFTELEQVVLNFVINAQQAIQSSGRTNGRVVIRTTDVDSRVRLEVEDNGPGVPPEVESKLFQPFFTTKAVGVGTGLGLSVSYGIVHSLGGTIGHRHNKEGGATFYFDLPRA